MKIRSFEVFGLAYSVKDQFGSSMTWHTHRNGVLLKLTSDDGMVGWGETYGPPRTSAAVLREVLGPMAVGQDPFKVEPLCRSMARSLRDPGYGYAISAVEMAMLDLQGKAMGMPLFQLLGGPYRQEVQAYASKVYYFSGDDMEAVRVRRAEQMVEAGFKAIKISIGRWEPERDLRNLRAIRRAVGDGIRLMVDANAAYPPHTALRVGRGLEQCGIYWFEEPLPVGNLEEYARLCEALEVPIAAGEHVYGRHAYADILRRRAMDILQPDVSLVGGVREAHRVANLARLHGLRCVPHCWGTGVCVAATLHLLATLPDLSTSVTPEEPMLELGVTDNALQTELVDPPPLPQDGRVKVPTGPGLGIQVNEELVRQYQVA